MSDASGFHAFEAHALPSQHRPDSDPSTAVQGLDALATPPSSPPFKALLPSSSTASGVAIHAAVTSSSRQVDEGREDEEDEAERWLLEAARAGANGEISPSHHFSQLSLAPAHGDTSTDPPAAELNGRPMPAVSSTSNDPSLQPRLPPEILRYMIVTYLQPLSILDDGQVHATLHALSQVSKMVRCWAMETRYSTLILPRAVRDFKKWFGRISKGGELNVGKRPFEYVGWTRAIFTGLIDVARLTSASQGWESQFLQLLHYAGPRLEYLSLWVEESKVVLRDASQVKGRHGHLAGGKTSMFIRNEPVWSWGEGLEFEDGEGDEESSDEEGGSKGRAKGEGKDQAWEAEREARILKAEAAAARERARQTIPTWLRRELEVQPASEVRKRFRAHLPTEPIEGDAYWEALGKVEPSSRKGQDNAAPTSGRQLRKAPRRGCSPRFLSIHINPPLFEHSRPSVFRRMTIWKRLEELDVYVNSGGQVDMVLFLLSHLDNRQKFWRLRVSSNHATLAIQARRAGEDGRGDVPDEAHSESDDEVERNGHGRRERAKSSSSKQPEQLNLARSLRAMLASMALRSALLDEFKGNHVSRPDLLVSKLEQAALYYAQARAGGAKGPEDSQYAPASPEDPVQQDEDDTTPSPRPRRQPIRVVLVQRDQSHLARLKDRRLDFLDRVEGGQGYWAQLGLDREQAGEER